MRTMYDAVTPTNILNHDTTPEIVGGYANGTYAWSDEEWALFPNARKLRIAVRATEFNAHVLDCEVGDATPDECPDWVLTRRNVGAFPIIYCNRSTWVDVIRTFATRGVAQPLYFIATASGVAELPNGPDDLQYLTSRGIATNVAQQALSNVVAAQYRLDWEGVDVSIVADYVPGLDPTSPTPSTSDRDEEDEMQPKEYAPSPGQSFDALIHDGSQAVLNVIAVDDAKPVFFSKLANWGPKGGTGGGVPVDGNNLPTVPGGYRIDPNLPGQFIINAGTTRVFLGYSCNGRTRVQIVKV